MSSPPVFEQDTWRIRTDTNGANGGTATWGTTEDQAADFETALDTTFRIRFVVSNTSGNRANNDDMELRWRIDTGAGFGSWTALSNTTNSTTDPIVGSSTASSSSDFATIASANYELTAGTGTAQSGHYFNDNAQPTGNTDEPDAGNYCEFEWGLECRSGNTNAAAAGDVIELQLYQDGSAMAQNYTNIPSIKIPDAQQLDQSATCNITGAYSPEKAVTKDTLTHSIDAALAALKSYVLSFVRDMSAGTSSTSAAAKGLTQSLDAALAVTRDVTKGFAQSISAAYNSTRTRGVEVLAQLSAAFADTKQIH